MAAEQRDFEVLLGLDGSLNDQYFFGNVSREFGEPKKGELYRIIIMPSFPHELGTNHDGVG